MNNDILLYLLPDIERGEGRRGGGDLGSGEEKLWDMNYNLFGKSFGF